MSKPIRPTYTSPPTWEDYAPAPVDPPEEFSPPEKPAPTLPEKGAKSDEEHAAEVAAALQALEEEHAAEVEAAKATHEAEVAAFYAERRSEREAAEATFAQALTAHQEAWEASLATWEAEVRDYRGACPGGPLCGAWLAEQRAQDPGAYPGVEAVDDGDGLGPRLHGWEGEAPDLEAYAAVVAEREAAAQQHREDLAKAAEAVRGGTASQEQRDMLLLAALRL